MDHTTKGEQRRLAVACAIAGWDVGGVNRADLFGLHLGGFVGFVGIFHWFTVRAFVFVGNSWLVCFLNVFPRVFHGFVWPCFAFCCFFAVGIFFVSYFVSNPRVYPRFFKGVLGFSRRFSHFLSCFAGWRNRLEAWNVP